MEERDYHLLQEGRKLNNRYVIERVLGEGGFGITYLGTDTLLNVKVAIKEFYPHGIVTRNNSVDDEVTVSYSRQSDTFRRGKQRFLEEAQIVAKFKSQEGIVDVTDFFEANNTVYMVMEYLDGITLKSYLQGNGPIDAEDMLEMLVPVLEALDEVHKQGLIHRDISPDNLMLMENGKIKLMDFGAARDYTDAGEKSLSIVLKPGYAPEEQYRSRGEQGPWTDIYAFCATLYKAITGVTPEESMQRAIEDHLKKPSELGVKLPSSMERAMMKGLSVFQRDRYQNLRDFCQDLYGNNKRIVFQKKEKPLEEKEYGQERKSASAIPKKWFAIGGIAVAVVLVILLIATLGGGKKETAFPEAPTERTIVSDVTGSGQWMNGSILSLEVTGEEINDVYETYEAQCSVSYNDAASGMEEQETIEVVYVLEDGGWVFSRLEN